MIKGTELENEDVVTVLRKAFTANQILFNNAAQSYNHEFYWNVRSRFVYLIVDVSALIFFLHVYHFSA